MVFKNPAVDISIIGNFRSDYEYAIEYEHDFLNLVRVLYITPNSIPRVSSSSVQEQEESKALGM